MTHEASEHGAHGTPAHLPFSETEWQELQAADRQAASAVVLLMVSIFLTGVVIYTIVAWSTAG